MLHYEKDTLEMREVAELHYCDSTYSNYELSSYNQSIKLIFTRGTTHAVNNETLDLYYEGATLSKFIHEGRLTTTKPTFVALPSLTSHSTFYECSRGIFCQPQDSHHRPLTRNGCDYFLFPTPGKKYHITIDIHYSLEYHNGIHTKEVDLLNLKAYNNLPSWSFLPTPLSNRHKDYFFRFLRLHGNNLH